MEIFTPEVNINSKMVADMYEIFSTIKETSGKNDKIQIVKDNEHNEVFKQFLTFLYDDMITTGLSTQKVNKKIKTNGAVTIRGFDSPIAIMDYLEKWNTGTDKIIYEVQTYLRDLDEPYRTFMSEVLTKKYKCGITATSVNKAIPNHIHQFKVQLAYPYEKFADKIDGEFTITTKLDGHRTLAEVHDDGKVIFRTRKGHQIHGMIELEHEFRAFFPVVNDRALMIDGEITVSDKDIPIEDVFQATSKIIRKDGEKTGLAFHVFDALPLDEFWHGESNAVYNDRRSALNHLFENNSYNPEHIELVKELYTGSDKNKIVEHIDIATKNGEEGIMLNLSDEPYRNKRTKGLLKVKKFHSADVFATSIFEGEGKYKGMLGGVYVQFKNSEVGVGSGFTDEQRKYYWENPEEIVEKIIEITYFEESKNQKDNSISLRFPIFKSVRNDKTVEDVNYD